MAWIFTTDGDYVNFNGGGNLWRLHKDSNCISWHWDETGDLFFDVYDQEYTVKAGNIADVIIDGTPLSAASGFPAAIQAVFTGLSSPGGSSYLVYTALLSQSGTDAPVATVLENTLGGTVVWTRDGAAGQYKGTLTNAFTENKSFVIITQGGSYMDTLNNYIDAYAFFGVGDDDNVWVYSELNGQLTDGQMASWPIEIRVYP